MRIPFRYKLLILCLLIFFGRYAKNLVPGYVSYDVENISNSIEDLPKALDSSTYDFHIGTRAKALPVRQEILFMYGQTIKLEKDFGQKDDRL